MAGTVARQTRERSVVGTPTQVSAMLDALRAAGCLVEATPLRPIRNRPGQYLSVVRLGAVRPPPRGRLVRPVRRRRGAAVAAGVALALAGLAAGGYLLVAALLGALAQIGTALLGVAVVVALVWVLLGQTGHCPGLHCPGCKCGR